MPVLIALAALLMPRVAVIVLWFLTRWFVGMFSSLLWPVVGFIFAPTTLLWYSVVQHWFGGVWSLWPVVGLVLALIIDLSPVSETRRFRSRRGDPALA